VESARGGSSFIRGAAPTPASPSGLTGDRLFRSQAQDSCRDRQNSQNCLSLIKLSVRFDFFLDAAGRIGYYEIMKTQMDNQKSKLKEQRNLPGQFKRSHFIQVNMFSFESSTRQIPPL